MTDYHISPSGNDTTGTGSVSAPFLTVAKANTLLATAVGGDKLRFYGGASFTDAVLTATSKTYTGAGVTIESYGTGVATIGVASATTHGALFTSCSGLYIRNIDIVKPSGVASESPNDTKACLAFDSCTGVLVEDVNTTGSARGVSIYGTGSSVTVNRVIAKHAWVAAFACAGAGTATFTEITGQGSGYATSYASSTATATFGVDLLLEGTVTVVVDGITTANAKGWCVRALQTVNRANVFRLQTVHDRNDRLKGWVYSSSTAGITIRDSALRVLKTSGLGTFDHVEVPAGGKVAFTNTAIYDDHRTGTIDTIDYSGAELTLTNCLIYQASAHTIIRKSGGATNPVGTKNCYYVQTPSGSPFDTGAGITYAAWAALYETNSLNVDPQLANTNVPGVKIVKVAATSPLINAGSNLSAGYGSVIPRDLFGTTRSTALGSGVWVQWSIGAHEVLAPTAQSFIEGSSNARLDSATDIVSYASRRVLPPFAGFPLIDHEVSVNVVPTLGIKQVGLWAVGGPVGGFTGTPSQPFTVNPYDTTFRAGSDQALEAAGLWDLGRTPGTDDPRRITVVLKPTTSGVPTALSSLSLEVGAVLPAGTGPGLNQTTTIGPLSGVSYGTSAALRLKIKYVGPTASGHRLHLTVLVNSVEILTNWELVLPIEWISGSGIPGAAGPAGYAGIVGARSTFSGALALSTPSWTGFAGSVVGGLSALPLPVALAGEAREKFSAAPRAAVPNRCRNGAFTAHAGLYGANYAVQRLVGAVPLPPPVTPGGGPTSQSDPPLRLHLQIIWDGHQLNGSYATSARTALSSYLSQHCPLDGGVALSILWHGYSTGFYSGGFRGNPSNNFYGSVLPLLAPTRVTSANLSTLLSTVAGIPDGVGQGTAYGTVLQQSVTTFAAGVPSSDSVIDYGGGRVVLFMCGLTNFLGVNGANTVPVGFTNDVTAFLQQPNLLEASLFAFRAPTTTFSPTDSANPFTAYFPLTTPALTVATSSLATPLALSTDASTPAGAVTPAEMATALDTIIDRRRVQWEVAHPISLPGTIDPQLGGAVAPIPADSVYTSAYQSGPDHEAGWAFTTSGERSAESPLGAWSIYGAAAGVEVAPQDDDADNWSYDGGSLLRITFASAGTLYMRQDLQDVRPFRGQQLTFAYSGRASGRSTQVKAVVWFDDVPQTLSVDYSSTFGVRTRRVVVKSVPKSVKKVAFGFEISGRVGSGVGLSGVALALGDYAFDLPYTACADDTALPPGTLIMVTGAECPSGFMHVPEADDRLIYTTAGDPGFLQRTFTSQPTAAAGVAYDSDLDVVCVLNTQAGQARPAAKTTNLAWVDELLSRRLPRNGRVRVAIIAGNSAAPGVVVLPPTFLDDDAASTVSAALASLATLDNAHAFSVTGAAIAANLTAAYNMLAAQNGRTRVVLFNVGGDVNLTESSIVTAATALHGLARMRAVSAVVVESKLSTAVTRGAEALIYPSPALEAPGLLFAATGGYPGSAAANFWSGQPYYAGVYAGSVFAEEIADLLVSIDEELDIGQGVGTALFTGGVEEHDHVAAPAGSPLGAADVYEEASSAAMSTTAPIPINDQAVVRGYPFGYYPSKRRPEDPPTYAVGINHTHAVQTNMTSFPPAFPMRLCRKL